MYREGRFQVRHIPGFESCPSLLESCSKLQPFWEGRSWPAFCIWQLQTWMAAALHEPVADPFVAEKHVV